MTQVWQLKNYRAVARENLSHTLHHICLGAELIDAEGKAVTFRSTELPGVEYIDFRFTREAVGVIKFEGYDIKE